jgi:hypothetical protein
MTPRPNSPLMNADERGFCEMVDRGLMLGDFHGMLVH